ncbi:hypothetical protein OnM2_063052 [Erysiphe neolycopersici]|uniref:Uncharacterized protein n=1 Tax=Erysiphe neolycopersici TaxID=212602 RepID=A0A420HNU9_9PEZI|nr:hypothetical protein OnM2_063052 [Erysiphe neolycopersici]
MEVLGLIRRGRITLSNELWRRASESSSGSRCGPNPCEKPTSSSTFTLPIILGVAVPLVGAAILFMILQRRHTRKIREEDANDLHASLDFGLGDVSQPGRSKRVGSMAMKRENSSLSRRQVSMDMTINNAYLPSFETKGSRESLDSLSLPFRKEDPYGPLSKTNSSDAGSTRSQSRIATGNSDFINSLPRFYDKPDVIPDNSSAIETKTPQTAAFPPRVNSLLPIQPRNKTHPNPSIPNPSIAEPPQAYISNNPVAPTTRWTNGQSLNQQFQPQSQFLRSESENNVITDNRTEGSYNTEFDQTYSPKPPMALDLRGRSQPSNINVSGYALAPQPVGFGSTNMNYIQGQGAQISNNQHIGDNTKFRQNQGFTSVGNNEKYYNSTYNNPKMTSNRYSTLGSRPLPPNTITDTDDPEIRANRIRSFYKEYFDDNAPAPAGRYENHKFINHNDDRTYYDPSSNHFVLPYEQPVTRRAMTPPPMPRRVGPGRARNTSMGVMDYNNQGQFMNNPSEMRAYSPSPRQGPSYKQPTLPFVHLNPLPTPGKMKDDMSTFDTLGYAPPVTYRERAGSLSRSPFSDVRPY